jgi:hypothetical protein
MFTDAAAQGLTLSASQLTRSQQNVGARASPQRVSVRADAGRRYVTQVRERSGYGLPLYARGG